MFLVLLHCPSFCFLLFAFVFSTYVFSFLNFYLFPIYCVSCFSSFEVLFLFFYVHVFFFFVSFQVSKSLEETIEENINSL